MSESLIRLHKLSKYGLCSFFRMYLGVVGWCDGAGWVNFQCRGVLLIWLIVGQGPTVIAVGAGGGCLDIFTLTYLFSPLSRSLWETARYRLKYCLKGPLTQSNQPTNRMCLLLLKELLSVLIIAKSSEGTSDSWPRGYKTFFHAQLS